MKLEVELEGSGYAAAVAELEEFRRVRDMLRRNLAAGVQPNVRVETLLADLAELEAGIKRCEKVLAQEYAAAIRYLRFGRVFADKKTPPITRRGFSL